MPTQSVIDVHMHLYPEARIAIQAMGGTARAGFTGTPPEAAEFMRENSIVLGVMCNFTPIHDMHVANLARIPDGLSEAERAEAERKVMDLMRFRVGERNEWSCRVSSEYPQLLTFIGIDPVLSPSEIEAEVERRYHDGARGIKLHPPVQRVPLDDERWLPGLAVAERLGMVVLTHMGAFGDISGDYATIERAVRVAEQFPDLKLILAHAGGPDRQAVLAALERFPNLLVDTVGVVSGDESDEELADRLLAFGSDRIVFGSDWCFRDPRPDIARIESLPLPAEVRAAILHDNAARLLGVEQEG